MKKYERKKKKAANQGRVIITEPTRRSILDVVDTNLKIGNRAIYLHRLIYIGQHHYDGNTNIVEALEKNYKNSNTGFSTEPISGILLYYHHYFCYIVDGAESTLNRHLSYLFEHNDGPLFNVKLLAAVHHIKARFWSDWMSYFGRPPERVEEIDPDSDMENSMRYVKECCEKLYKFANAFIADQMKLRSKYLDEQEGESDDEESDDSIRERPLLRKISIVDRDPYSDFLPEVKLLDFLVKCKHCKDLMQYHRYYQYIGQSADYSLKVWPAPRTIIPYDVFDKPSYPIEDLPTKEEEGEKEEEDEELTLAIPEEVILMQE